MPQKFQIVGPDGGCESCEGKYSDRYKKQEFARDNVFWGGGIYNGFIVVLGAAILAPLLPFTIPSQCMMESTPDHVTTTATCATTPLNTLSGGVGELWRDAFIATPPFFLSILGALIVLFVLRWRSAGQTRHLANLAWTDIDEKTNTGPANPTLSFTRKLRGVKQKHQRHFFKRAYFVLVAIGIPVLVSAIACRFLTICEWCGWLGYPTP
ncbi:MAG: hypothetical protein ACKVH0_06955 [Alphaproteobacteria bacterium]